jgi:prepilin-type N-terminal cleavage/methylation domain-containing protein
MPVPFNRNKGFTLVELLLVVAILSIVSMVVIPSMARSIKGSRMQVATRTVISAGKYARCMAVLKQKEMALVFNIEDSSIRIMPIKIEMATATNNTAEAGLPGSSPAPAGAGESGPEVKDDQVSSGFTGELEMTKTLDRIAIESVDADGKEQLKGTCTIIYSNNGRCAPYKVRLRDEADNVNEISVDALATAQAKKLY